MAKTLSVRGAEAVYPIIIRPNALIEDLPTFAQQGGFSNIAIITNDRLAPLYGDALRRRLPSAFLLTVPDGEAYKNLDTVQTLYSEMVEAGADRSTLVIGLGGGVIGDMAGFVAATYMRGIAFVQAPTSLLAMVDASIGGKVGVDLAEGKNLVGAFKDPLAVFADTATLQTLDDIEFRCGLAEVVKSALIADPLLFDHLLERGPEPIVETIERTVAVKIKLVEEDRLEGGRRAFLNLGHTFGHAIEQVSGYAWKHGQAVAVGLVAAARLSTVLGLCDPSLPSAIEDVLQRLKLPTRFRDLDTDTLWESMSRDKKWRSGTPTFILLQSIGHPVIIRDLTRTEVVEVLESLREN